jgi:hypothetical protein
VYRSVEDVSSNISRNLLPHDVACIVQCQASMLFAIDSK